LNRKVRHRGQATESPNTLSKKLRKEKKKKRRRKDGEESEKSRRTEKKSLLGRNGRAMTK